MPTAFRTLALLAAILPAAVSTSPLAGAPLQAAAAVRSAAGNLGMTEQVACYGFGWRGWGIYPGWYPACNRPLYAAPVYAAPDYPVPAPGRCWVPPTPDGRPGYWATC